MGTKLLLMFIATAAISFFVAFLVQMIFSLVKIKSLRSLFVFKPGENKQLSAHEINELQKEAGNPSTDDEVYAAIGLALYLYMEEMEAFEKLQLTIKKTVKTYSPWSSKIYGIRQHPR